MIAPCGLVVPIHAHHGSAARVTVLAALEAIIPKYAPPSPSLRTTCWLCDPMFWNALACSSQFVSSPILVAFPVSNNSVPLSNSLRGPNGVDSESWSPTRNAAKGSYL